MDRKTIFQHHQDPEDILSVVLLVREESNIPNVVFGEDTVVRVYMVTIYMVSGNSPLDGKSIYVAGGQSTGYAEAVRHILEHHPEYQHIT